MGGSRCERTIHWKRVWEHFVHAPPLAWVATRRHDPEPGLLPAVNSHASRRGPRWSLPPYTSTEVRVSVTAVSGSPTAIALACSRGGGVDPVVEAPTGLSRRHKYGPSTGARPSSSTEAEATPPPSGSDSVSSDSAGSAPPSPPRSAGSRRTCTVAGAALPWSHREPKA